ncbi:MAG: hypothetical protein A2504_13115 [Bdellovibrionales bacterium RIFOXYD12_FULL_39_22]|nr:MAG: hypothetical protein A2385_00915 [Bdellovibrionales bacterium RIFOXYB1_FULL_39_21]OFZ43568.1 MAG: hypothetical protein A2485_12585 [Bdellovibrionales bacterium RIFOXYC12_FULL_39_17]OFZ44587.1 MAG: hypothetical protein A2404_10275 [Bdellovibrionales bacterium RIFOXYC1_FULL_39_130]OFZ73953.1 MAG: hypothetical protein A2451_08560 [Bdellovibrionales bacterium RIFOXYC2_FULL_39_8]OFZ76346.1 MAG: hypothetical protein A2560_06895 [Bdellovibrionales bacterium RIFOXYD1_FULL_39_84]OFZ94612.1 MAG:
MSIYVNRVLNMKKIKAIGFDMDYTLVRYNTENFEEFTYYVIIEKLIKEKNYPAAISEFKFEYNRVIQGLVLDKKNGNILKLSRFGKVKSSYHGTSPIDFTKQKEIYENKVIDLSDNNIESLDTLFAIAHGVLFSQLIDYKNSNGGLSSYEQIALDIRYVLDLAHQDGSIKDEVRRNISKYIIPDLRLPRLLEVYRDFGKKLIIVTNSDYAYTKLLMDYAFTPYLAKYKSWTDLFELVITGSSKPKFFTQKSPFLHVNPETGLMSNYRDKLRPGIYQGGSAFQVERDLDLNPTEILYIGDHIYGDVVSLKKTFQWRTALVLAPLEEELAALKTSLPNQHKIDKAMQEKSELEAEINRLYNTEAPHKHLSTPIYEKIEKINQKISTYIEENQKFFNPYWGSLMRAGQEESLMAAQIEKYACLYMVKVSDLVELSPKSYYRPRRRTLPHEHLE